MRAGVRADEPVLPISRRAFCVVAARAGVVVGAFVTEQRRGTRRSSGVSRKQPIPVIVAALVPHVSEQRPIRLAHRCPAPLALGIVGFGDVDGDDAVSVPGQQGWAPGPRVGEELEREPVLRIVGAAWHGQAKLHQCEQKAPLGR